MSALESPALESTAAPSRAGSDQLEGLTLTLARIGWVALAALVVALNIAGIPAGYAQLLIVCQPDAPCSRANLTPAELPLLPVERLTIQSYAAFQVWFVTVGAFTFILIGALIFLRRSSSRMALFASITLVLFGGSIGRTAAEGLIGAVEVKGGLIGMLAIGVKFLGTVSFPILFYLFPSGHWAPRWTRWLVIPVVIDGLLLVAVPQALQTRYTIALNLLFVVIVFLTITAQVRRYFYISTLTERQQTKWAVYGFALGAGAFAAITILTSLVFPQAFATPLGNIFTNVAIGTAMSMVPVSIGIAILRSRLFDVDILIKRTLTYGVVTATLAILYLVGVIGLQGIVRPLTGQQGQQPWMIVLTTLVIAALFTPLRRGVQAVVDQRFYRSRYDATRTLERFTTSLRSDIDLASLTEHLIDAVDETMRPAHISLWLRPRLEAQAQRDNAAH